MSEGPPNQGDDTPKITVDDPEDYNLSRRFQQIHRARDRVKDVRDEAGAMVSRNEMSQGRYREELAQAVADFAIELEWLMKDEKGDAAAAGDGRRSEGGDEAGTSPGMDIWKTVEIEAPEHPEGKIEGIGGFVDRYGRIKVKQAADQDSAFASPRERVSQTVLGNPSIETTMRIYRQCNRFMKEIGLEVKFDRGLERDELG